MQAHKGTARRKTATEIFQKMFQVYFIENPKKILD